MHNISKSSNDMGAVNKKIKILCPRNSMLKTQTLILENQNSSLETQFLKSLRIGNHVSSRNRQLTFDRYWMYKQSNIHLKSLMIPAESNQLWLYAAQVEDFEQLTWEAHLPHETQPKAQGKSQFYCFRNSPNSITNSVTYSKFYPTIALYNACLWSSYQTGPTFSKIGLCYLLRKSLSIRCELPKSIELHTG